MQTQVLLVSEQTLPNLIPALMDNVKHVCIVCSQAMSQKGRVLKALFEDFGITVEQLDDAPTHDVQHITHYANQLLDVLHEAMPNCRPTLNATGGNKLMSFGFIDAFRQRGLPVIYADTANYSIETLPQLNGHINAIKKMIDVLKVRDYLNAQGLGYQNSDSQSPLWDARRLGREPVATFLAKNASQLSRFFSILNGMASSALNNTNTLVTPRQMFDKNKPKPSGLWAEALRLCETYQLLEWDGAYSVRFQSADAAIFLNGQWLEEYAYQAALEAGVFDVECGVKVQPTANIENEFDVLVCDGNQLLFMECKTARFQANQNDNQLAYKLDSLSKQARGLFGKTWLLSAQEPSDILRERAKNNRIEIVGPEALPYLSDLIERWRPSQKP